MMLDTTQLESYTMIYTPALATTTTTTGVAVAPQSLVQQQKHQYPALIPIETYSSDTKLRLRSQIEYYFSRDNLSRDSYLVSQMDGESYVALTIIINFNKVKLLTQSIEYLIECIRDSYLLELDASESRVRSKKRCMLILREIPQEHETKEQIEALFAHEKCPIKCDLCEYAGNDNWYCYFQNEEESQRALHYLKEQVQLFKGKPILARIKAPRSTSSYQLQATSTSTLVSSQPPYAANTTPSTTPPVTHLYQQQQQQQSPINQQTPLITQQFENLKFTNSYSTTTTTTFPHSNSFELTPHHQVPNHAHLPALITTLPPNVNHTPPPPSSHNTNSNRNFQTVSLPPQATNIQIFQAPAYYNSPAHFFQLQAQPASTSTLTTNHYASQHQQHQQQQRNQSGDVHLPSSPRASRSYTKSYTNYHNNNSNNNSFSPIPSNTRLNTHVTKSLTTNNPPASSNTNTKATPIYLINGVHTYEIQPNQIYYPHHAHGTLAYTAPAHFTPTQPLQVVSPMEAISVASNATVASSVTQSNSNEPKSVENQLSVTSTTRSQTNSARTYDSRRHDSNYGNTNNNNNTNNRRYKSSYHQNRDYNQHQNDDSKSTQSTQKTPPPDLDSFPPLNAKQSELEQHAQSHKKEHKNNLTTTKNLQTLIMTNKSINDQQNYTRSSPKQKPHQPQNGISSTPREYNNNSSNNRHTTTRNETFRASNSSRFKSSSNRGYNSTRGGVGGGGGYTRSNKPSRFSEYQQQHSQHNKNDNSSTPPPPAPSHISVSPSSSSTSSSSSSTTSFDNQLLLSNDQEQQHLSNTQQYKGLTYAEMVSRQKQQQQQIENQSNTIDGSSVIEETKV